MIIAVWPSTPDAITQNLLFKFLVDAEMVELALYLLAILACLM